MSTVHAIRKLRSDDDRLAEEMANAVAANLRSEEKPAPEPEPDPEATVERWADILHRSVAFRRKRIAATRKEEREFIKAHKAEIKRLEAEILEHKEGAARKIEAEQKIVTASKAFLAAVEE